jgi:predicted membrane-bound mannosyltransferase
MRSEDLPVLKTDLSVALIMIATGLLSDGVGAVRTAPLVAVAMFVGIAAVVYVAEHDVVPGVYPEVATIAAFLVVAAVGVGFVSLLGRSANVVGAAALTGGGVGLLCYRTLFGLVLAVPAYRLEKQQ